MVSLPCVPMAMSPCLWGCPHVPTPLTPLSPCPQDIKNKRNPRLVPYNLLDEGTKATNRESLCQAVRTLLGYGYNIEPPDQETRG